MDAIAAFQHEQQLTDQLMRQARRSTAAKVVQDYGERHELPPEDVTEILAALGLVAR